MVCNQIRRFVGPDLDLNFSSEDDNDRCSVNIDFALRTVNKPREYFLWHNVYKK